MSDPRSIGPYEVLGRLGRGNFGVVYRARHTDAAEDVAIKRCGVDDADIRRRFAREAKIAECLDHPAIVRILGAGLDGDAPYLVQEFLDGEDLDRIIGRQALLEPLHKLDILRQIAEGLGYAHRQGVIHRDIKPGNIRLLSAGQVKIMDFGIAKLAGAETKLTQQGVAMGTASYLPPELVRAEEPDPRSDIFSFGVLAYELLAYERPFRANTLSALVYQILYKVPPPLAAIWAECPDALSDLVARCLEKKRERRCPDFDAVLSELAELRKAMTESLVALGLEPPPPPVFRTTGSDGDDAGGASGVPSPEPFDRPAEDGTQPVGTRPREDEDVDRSDPMTRTLPISAVTDADLAAHAAPAEASAEEASEPLPDSPLEADAEVTPKAAEAQLEDTAPLAQRAETIGSLIAQGDLDAAMQEMQVLQEAVHGAAPEAETPPGDAAPEDATVVMPAPTPPEAPLDADAPEPPLLEEAETTILVPPEAPRPTAPQPPVPQPAAPQPAAPRPAAPQPAATKSAATKPMAPQPAAPESTVAAPPLPAKGAPRQPSPAAAKTMVVPKGETSSGRSRWPMWIVSAVVALLALLFFRRGGEEDPTPEVSPPPAIVGTTAADAVPGAEMPRASGSVVVHPAPWGEIVEITDADGYLQPLPGDGVSPLTLRLPEGRYRMTVAATDGSPPAVCDLEVVPDGSAVCAPVLGTDDVTDYFKAAGWWR